MTPFLGWSLAGLAGGACSAFVWRASQHREQLIAQCEARPASPFSPDSFKAFKLISSRYESHDTRRFYFALDSSEDVFSMPMASCIVVRFSDAEGKEVLRPYTPISPNGTKGHFELLVKKYPKDISSNALFNMQPGDAVWARGPFERFAYRPNLWKHVGMIAGGIGITPMYQAIRAILENPKDKTQISLIYANDERKDILLANELVELQKTYSNFSLYLTLLQVPRRWLGGIGHVNAAMISTYMPKPDEKNIKLLVCGSPPMMQAMCGDKLFKTDKLPQQGPLKGLLRELGYRENQVFKF